MDMGRFRSVSKLVFAGRGLRMMMLAYVLLNLLGFDWAQLTGQHLILCFLGVFPAGLHGFPVSFYLTLIVPWPWRRR